MEKITEKILWNDVLALMDKYKHHFMIGIVREFKSIRFKLDTDNDGTLKLIVSRPSTIALASAEAMTAIALIMIKYHPDVKFKLYRMVIDVSYNKFGEDTDRHLITFDPLETVVGFMTTSLRIIRSIALNETDEDLIKYVVPRLDKTVIDNWLKFCDDLSLLESKSLILRYANYNDDTEDMKL